MTTTDGRLTPRDLAAEHLAGLPRRWAHTRAVAATAERIAPLLGLASADEEALVAAAWLHDIGYAHPHIGYRFHPLDGALLLRTWDMDRVANLVAHHTTADVEARLLGLTGVMGRYPDEGGMLAAALTYCDMTNGPDGQPMTFAERFAEVRERYASQSTPVRAMSTDWGRLLDVESSVSAAIGLP